MSPPPVLLLLLLPLGIHAEGEVHLKGSGGTILCPLMALWREVYANISGVQVSYECIGSGGGQRNLKGGTHVFAGTDSVIEESAYEEYPDLQMIPLVAVPIGVTYNVNGLDQQPLVLSREVLVSVFSGKVTHWDDPAILESNPTLRAPHERIRVAVRSGKSGTNEIFTSALHAFLSESDKTLWSPSPYWPDELRAGAEGEKLGSTGGLVTYVRDNPWSIGIASIQGILSRYMPYAVVVNKVGKATLPGWADGEQAARGLAMNATRLTGSLVDGLGYPILGISYLAFRRDAPPAVACAVQDFIYWLLMNPSAGATITRNALVRMSNSAINTAFARLALPQCAGKLSEAVGVGGRSSIDLVKVLGWYYNSKQSVQYIEVGKDEGTPPLVLRGEGGSNSAMVSVPVAAGMYSVIANFGIDQAQSIELDLRFLAEVFRGGVKWWNATGFFRPANLLIPPSMNAVRVTLVSDALGVTLQRLLRRLEVATAEATQILIVPTQVDVASFVRKTRGALGVVESQVAEEWRSSTVHPVVGAAPIPPDIDAVSEDLHKHLTFDPLLKTATIPPHAPIYPFVHILFLDVVADRAPPEPGSGACLTGHASFARWAVSSSAQKGYREAGFAPLEWLAPEQERSIASLRCGGVPIYAGGRDESKNLGLRVLVGVVSAFGGVLLVLLGVLGWNWRKGRQAYANTYGANVVAAETAEAIAVLDFESLGKLNHIENPDRVQVAMRQIVEVMKEFVKFIPQHVIRSVRQDPEGTEGEAEDGNSSCTSALKSSATGSTRLSSVAVGSSSGGLRSAEIYTRLVTVLVARPSPSNAAVDTAYTSFLAEAIAISAFERGILHKICDDHIVITWGSMTNDARKPAVCRSAHRLSNIGGGVCCGIYRGSALCGTLGTETVRSFHVLGGVVQEADKLSRLAVASSAPCILLKGFVGDLWGSLFRCCLFFPVVGVEEAHDTVVLLGDISWGQGKEWMYALADNEDAEELRPGPELAFDLYFKEGVAQAVGHLLDVHPRHPHPLFGSWCIQAFRFAERHCTADNNARLQLTVGVCGTVFSSEGFVVSRPQKLRSLFGPQRRGSRNSRQWSGGK